MQYIHKDTNLPLTEDLKDMFYQIIAGDKNQFTKLEQYELKMFEDFKKCLTDLSMVCDLFSPT